MRVAYFTPLNPLKSGVCDVVESVLPTLSQYKDIQIDLFISPGYQPSNPEVISRFSIYPMSEYDKENIRSLYHLSVFHMGNNISFHDEVSDYFFKYGGILEIHDVSLHHFLYNKTIKRGNFQEYIDTVVYCHGEEMRTHAIDVVSGIRHPLQDSKGYYPVNKKYIDHADAIIVHSDFAKQIVKGIRSNVRTVTIPLPPNKILDIDPEENKKEKRLKLGIPLESFVMGSFGYASRAKRIFSIIDALAHLKDQVTVPVHYYIVGFDEGLDLKSYIALHNLTELVTVVGETTTEDFEAYIDVCDLCFNLRYPTQGESSASFPRLAAKGKVIAVTNIGSFEEYDSDIVYKIRYDDHEISDICNTIMQLINNPEVRRERQQKTLEFARRELDISTIAKRYHQFYWEILYKNHAEHEYIDLLTDHILSLGLNEELYLKHLCNHYDFIFNSIEKEW